MSEINDVKAYALQKLINTCFEAVEKSSVGPIYVRDRDGSLKLGPTGETTLSMLPYNTFLYLISAMAPKNMSIDMEGIVKDVTIKEKV